MRKTVDFLGQDQAILTEEEVEYVRAKVVETMHHRLVAGQLFNVKERIHPGKKFYTYYTETDPSDAIIDMDGVAQVDDSPLKTAHEVKVPVIYKTALVPWRDILSSETMGPSLLDDCARTLGYEVADAKDRLFLSGECTTWAALGIEGLATATGRGSGAAGAWPANALANINTGRAWLEGQGFEGIEPVLIGPPAIIKCLDQFVTNTAVTYRQALLEAGVISAAIESSNVYAADCGQDSALLVVPGEDNFYEVEGMAPTVRLWYDKMGSAFLTVRNIATPVIPRPTSIYEITTIVCS